MDEVKIIESSNSKSLPSHPQTETSNQTLPDPTRATPKFKYTSQKPLIRKCPVQQDTVWLPPDIAQNLNMSLMTSFLRELYKYPSRAFIPSSCLGIE
jgi:hypothetical protein